MLLLHRSPLLKAVKPNFFLRMFKLLLFIIHQESLKVDKEHLISPRFIVCLEWKKKKKFINFFFNSSHLYQKTKTLKSKNPFRYSIL